MEEEPGFLQNFYMYIHVFTCIDNIPIMSVRIPKDLKNEIDDHLEINRSEMIRQSMWKYLRRLELADKIAS